MGVRTGKVFLREVISMKFDLHAFLWLVSSAGFL